MGLSDMFKASEYKATIERLQYEKYQLQHEKDIISTEFKQLSAKSDSERQAFIKETAELKAWNKVLSESNESLKSKCQEQERIISTGDRRIYDAEKRLEDLQLEADTLDSKAEEKRKTVRDLEAKVIELNDAFLLQEFGLYIPRYAFATSEEYADRLKQVRDDQKEMIKTGQAAVSDKNWNVQNDADLGQKMVDDNIKQIVQMFNIECENVIGKVKFNNFDSSEKRVRASFERLNKLNRVLGIRLTEDYYKSKIDEMRIALEYARKVQEEKEYIREQRELARENARVQKELEAERRKLEKEQAQYSNQMERLREQLAGTADDNKKAEIQKAIDKVEAHLLDTEQALQDVDYRQANERAGYVYVISNIGAFGEGIYKIGMTRRLVPEDRVDELGNASVPFKFDIHAMIFSNDAPGLESTLHRAFSDRRVNMVNGRKEFFRVSLDEIEKVVHENHDRIVDFKKEAFAEQYRETLKMLDAKREKLPGR